MFKNKRLEQEWPWAIGVCVLSIIVTFFVIKVEPIVAIVVSCSSLVPYVNLFFTKQQITKVFKFIFGAYFLFALLSLILDFSARLSLLLMIFVPSYWMLVSSYFPKTNITNVILPYKHGEEDLETKVKQDLGLESVSNHKVSFWKPLSFIGGFMMPAFPFMTVVNKNWKQELNEEAKIHELVHIHLMLNKGYIYFGTLLIIAISFVSYTLFHNISDILVSAMTVILLSILFTFYEKKTFDYTHEYAKSIGVFTREFTWDKARKYMMLYAVQFSLLFLFWSVVKFVIKYISMLVL